MFLRGLLKPHLASLPLLTQIRNIRPIIKIGPDKFEVTVDVKQYTRYELRVKAQDKYVLIEGKQEREVEDGYVIRKFAKKFKLPPGCDPQKMHCSLSTDGLLKVEAKRLYFEPDLPTEVNVPIRYSDGGIEEAILRRSHGKRIDYCKRYPKVRVGPKKPVSGGNQGTGPGAQIQGTTSGSPGQVCELKICRAKNKPVAGANQGRTSEGQSQDATTSGPSQGATPSSEIQGTTPSAQNKDNTKCEPQICSGEKKPGDNQGTSAQSGGTAPVDPNQGTTPSDKNKGNPTG